MSYKIFSLFIFSLFAFATPQSLTKKITGKYGKMDREHGEYICLELFDNELFTMSISTCASDKYINGTLKSLLFSREKARKMV